MAYSTVVSSEIYGMHGHFLVYSEILGLPNILYTGYEVISRDAPFIRLAGYRLLKIAGYQATVIIIIY
jgi:hypothetical protein